MLSGSRVFWKKVFGCRISPFFRYSLRRRRVSISGRLVTEHLGFVRCYPRSHIVNCFLHRLAQWRVRRLPIVSQLSQGCVGTARYLADLLFAGYADAIQLLACNRTVEIGLQFDGGFRGMTGAAKSLAEDAWPLRAMVGFFD